MKGLRLQLLLLVVGALLPLSAFVAWTLYEQQLKTRLHFQEEAHDQANLLRSAIDGQLSMGEGVVASLVPLALRLNGEIERSDLEAIMRNLPSYTRNIVAYDVAGRLLSAYRDTPEPARGVFDHAYFQAALRTPGQPVSQPTVGRLTGIRMIKTALAYTDRKGDIAGVLILTTDLAKLEAGLLDPLVERHLDVAISSLDGRVLMRSKANAGIDPRQAPLDAALLHPEYEGEFESASGKVAFATVRTVHAPLAVIVMTGSEFSVGQGQRHTVMLLAAVMALAVGIACALGMSRHITSPLLLLNRAADRLGKGDFRHRVPPLAGEAGKVGRAFNTMAEQLESQRAAIRADAERFRAVFHHSSLSMAMTDIETGALLEVNSAFTQVTGKTANDVIGKTTAEIDLWVDPQQRTAALRLVKSHGRIEGFECRQRLGNGSVGDFLLFSEVLSIGERSVILTQAVDVTERKVAEAQLREVSKRLTLATRSARIGVWDLDLRTGDLTWDDTMLKLYHVPAEDFGGRFDDWLRFVAIEDRAEVQRWRSASRMASGELDLQYRVHLTDGISRHLRSSASVERDERGNPIRLMGTTRDVTESVLGREALARVNSELEARVVERTGELQETMRELEAFSYTVAHDLRAPLRAIDGFSSHLGRTLAASEWDEGGELLSKIRRNVSSMDRLIDGLLNYARLGRQSFAPVPVDMTGIAEDVRKEVLSAYPDLEITIDPLPVALGDPEMLRQVWSNLIGNACKFSRLRAAPRVRVGSAMHPDGLVYFVWDNGVGFDMRYSDRLFRVFERLHTEPEFGGTGVGLAIVQRVMQRHAGCVWAESSPGDGATFSFRVPCGAVL